MICKKFVGARVVIASVGGMATGGYAPWEPIEGRQVDSLNPLVPSNPPGIVIGVPTVVVEMQLGIHLTQSSSTKLRYEARMKLNSQYLTIESEGV